MPRLEERLEYGRYVTPRLARSAPIYNWYVFPHSYSRELVHELITEFGANAGTVVLDPFVGAGTTLLACRERGIPAVGVDQLPFAVFVSSVKTRDYDPNQLLRTLDGFQPLPPSGPTFGTIPIVDKGLSGSVREKVSSLYCWTQSLPRTQADFFLLALMSILERVSKTVKSGGWLRLCDTDVDPDQVESLFCTRAREMIGDLYQVALPANDGCWRAFLGDARALALADTSVHYVVTSPPYLNRHDYTRVFALELALHFAKTNGDLISLRANAMRSHVEAKQPAGLAVSTYRPTKALTDIILEIGSRMRGRDRNRLCSMISGYFQDVYLSLVSLGRLIAPGGRIAFVVGNVRFSGVMIPVDELIAEIGEQAGLEADAILVARYRGNSAQQMAQFGREPARESVVLWTKR